MLVTMSETGFKTRSVQFVTEIIQILGNETDKYARGTDNHPGTGLFLFTTINIRRRTEASVPFCIFAIGAASTVAIKRKAPQRVCINIGYLFAN